MKTTCKFIYSSPTPSVISRKSGSGVLGSRVVDLIVGAAKFSPAFLQMITSSLPIVISCRRIVVWFLVTGFTTIRTVAMRVDTSGKTITIVGAEFIEPVATTASTTTAVAVAVAVVGGRVGLYCSSDHSGDHLRHTIFRECRHPRGIRAGASIGLRCCSTSGHFVDVVVDLVHIRFCCLHL